MNVVAKILSEQDVNDESEWYSKIKIQIFDTERKNWRQYNK